MSATAASAPSGATSLEPPQVLALVDCAFGDDVDAVLWACDRLCAWVDAQRIRAIRLLRDRGAAGCGGTEPHGGGAEQPGDDAQGGGSGGAQPDEPGRADTAPGLRALLGVALPSLPAPTGPSTLRTPRELELLHRRAELLGQAPQFAAALHGATITAAHLDRFIETLRRLEPALRVRLLADEGRHVAVARSTNSNDFARHLRREEARLARHATGDRLEQQQRQVRLRHRVETDTGMHHVTLLLDPLSALRLDNRVDAATEALFHRATPDHCPTDPFERQAFLRAHALLSLLEGRGGGSGRPEIVVVVDTTVTDGPPDIDWGLPVEVPERVLRELHAEADVHTVVVRNGVVLHAPGALDLGRTTRLASRHQRRALRAMYRGCAVPGCAVRFDQCTVHHVEWWRHGGRTDLHNLLPLCHRHHTHVHRDGWQLQLDPRRRLTVTQPDGTVQTTGPPRRWAA